MDEQKDMFDLLDMMIQPVFCVKDHIIVRSNAAAQQLFLKAGVNILPMLGSHTEAYSGFDGGCLYLPLTIAGQTIGASLRRMNGLDVFELDSPGDSESLRAMALAAGSLRRPLSNAMVEAAALLDSQEDPETLRQLSQLNRNLYQLLRLLGNMSDAEYLFSHCRMETVDVPALFREIFGKAKNLADRAGITLSYEDLDASVLCLADKALLERAILNILSNSMKFTEKGGRIRAALTRRGATLRLTVQDSGCGISQEVMGSLFRRFLRQPGIEDSRYGMGLGIRSVHAAALHHGGTLLLTQNEDGGTCVSLTIAIRHNESATMRSPIFEIDYSGGFDHDLVELSDCLPAELYGGKF